MDAGYIISALTIGFAGSLHCVGMCGPLMMSGIIRKSDQSFSIFKWSLYHMGRIGVYMVWGLFFGFMGASARWFGFQQNISLSLGIGILVVLLLSKLFPELERYIHNNFLLKSIRAKIVPHIHSKIPVASLLGGMLNGMLPCGLVYVALAGATAMQDVYGGGLFMVFFGIGNLPMLFAVMLVGQKFQMPLRRVFSKWYPALIGVMAILLIVRGMNLGNFLSPALIKGKVDAVHCATR